MITVKNMVNRCTSRCSGLSGFSVGLRGLGDGLGSAIGCVRTSESNRPVRCLVAPSGLRKRLAMDQVPSVLGIHRFNLADCPSETLCSVSFGCVGLMGGVHGGTLSGKGGPSSTTIRSVTGSRMRNFGGQVPFGVAVSHSPRSGRGLAVDSVRSEGKIRLSSDDVRVRVRDLNISSRC